MTIAARYWTYAELVAAVEAEMGLEGEIFITASEMLGLFNQAIDEAERIVKGAYADYFLDKAALTIVAGVSEYALPTRIYAHKIRRITYRYGGDVYVIDRVRDWKKFQEYEEDQAAGTTGAKLRYMVINQTAGAPRILFTSAPSSTDAAATVTVWFMRQANRLVSSSDVLDVPEAANYVMQYVKYKCYEKEGNPLLPLAIAQLNDQEQKLGADLADMIPDADDALEMDLSFYEDMA